MYQGEGEQTIKPAIIFRGIGNVSLQELSKHDKRIDFHFQRNAWIDHETTLEWMKKNINTWSST